MFAHDPRDPLAARRPTAPLQRRMNARATVGAPAFGVHRLHLLDEFGPVDRPRRRRAVPKRVEAAARYAELPAHEVDREIRLLRVDEAKLHFVSLAKKAAAFY
jgi:hypothetical protein